MKCIVWLGNPGLEYKTTRHNMGALALEFLRSAWNFPDFTASKHHAVMSEWMHKHEKVVLVQPLTYMNLSGQSVSSLLSFYKLNPETDLLVISDDLDMEFGKIRLRAQGSSGGQNGIRSIIELMGNDAFSRLKIGIGRDARYEVSDWVLSRLTKPELSLLEDTIFPAVVSRAEDWLTASIV